ncbi:MAG: hypothetical protein WBQ45_20440, partial [Roseiarcus sp.]
MIETLSVVAERRFVASRARVSQDTSILSLEAGGIRATIVGAGDASMTGSETTHASVWGSTEGNPGRRSP